MQSQPVLLIVGQGEPMEGSLTEALERHGLEITRCATPDVHTHVEQIAPDMLVLIGDSAVRGGSALIRTLTLDAETSILPIILVSNEATLEPESSSFRTGPVAVLPRGLGAEAVARRIAELAVEVPQRSGLSTGDLTQESLQTLIDLVSEELKAGILSIDSDAPGVDSVSVVLDTERPPATNIEEALSQLQAMLPRSEELHYEFYETAGGRVSLLSAEQESTTADLEYLRGVRVVLMDGDSERNRVLLQALASRGAQAVIAEPNVSSLSGIRDIDPQVAIFGAESIQGEGFEVVRQMRQDPQLQWASLLVVRWDEIWPESAYAPDLVKLANRIAALTKQDAALQRRAEEESRFDTRLESLGPGRLVRALASLPGSRHVTVAGRTHAVELDIADGVVLGAYVTSDDEAPAQGIPALTALWNMPTGRVTVWEQDVPSIANVMMPVDEALGLAARELDESEPSTGVHAAPVDVDAPTLVPPSRSSQDLPAVESVGGPGNDDFELALSREMREDGFDEEQPTTQWVEPIAIDRLSDVEYEASTATARALPEPFPPLDDVQLPEPARFQSSVRARPDSEEVPTTKVKQPATLGAPDPALTAPRPARVSVRDEESSQRPTVWFLLLLLTAAVALFVRWVGEQEEAAASLAQPTLPPAAPVIVEPVEVREVPEPIVVAEQAAPEAEPTVDPATPEAEPTVDPYIAEALARLPANPQKASDVLVWRAIPKIRKGELAAAEAILERAWALDDKNPQAMAAFAELHIAKQNPSQAVVWAEIAVQKRPRRAQYHLIYGDALQLSGDTDAAKKAWRKTLQLDSGNRAARRRLRDAK